MFHVRLADGRLVSLFLWIFSAAVLLVVVAADQIASHGILVEGACERSVYPRPFYRCRQLPERGGTAVGTDFSQVYFSAKALRHGESEYAPKSKAYSDPFSRRPNYPPFTNRLYLPLSSLSYSNALVVHSYGTVLFFALVVGVLLYRLRLFRHVGGVFALCFLLLFYTPLGLSHWERGQFDLWVAASYLLIFASLYDEKPIVLGMASGLLAGIKWSTLPCLASFSLVAFATGDRSRRWACLSAGVVFLISVIAFFPALVEYWPSLKAYEIQAGPSQRSLSFLHLLPRLAAKSVQLISALLVIGLIKFATKGSQGSFSVLRASSFPLLLTMFIQGICFGTQAYEYRIVSALGLIPAFVIWVTKTEGVPQAFKAAAGVVFATFLLLAFRVSHGLLWEFLEARTWVVMYAVASLIALALTCLVIIKQGRSIKGDAHFF